MKLHLSTAIGVNAFTAYGADYATVNGVRHDRPLVVLPDRLLTDWTATSFDALAAADFATLVDLDREIVLLGTGPRLRFPPAPVIRPLVEAGIGLEVMDMQAACRTYNILVAEDRRVAAALLFR